MKEQTFSTVTHHSVKANRNEGQYHWWFSKCFVQDWIVELSVLVNVCNILWIYTSLNANGMIFLSKCCLILCFNAPGNWRWSRFIGRKVWAMYLLISAVPRLFWTSATSTIYWPRLLRPSGPGPCDIEQQKSYFVTRCNTGLWEEALLSVKVKIWKLIWGPAFHLCQGFLMKYKYCTHPELRGRDQRKHFVMRWHRDTCVTEDPWHVTRHTVSRSAGKIGSHSARDSYKIRSGPILFHDIVPCQLQVTVLKIIILEETKN